MNPMTLTVVVGRVSGKVGTATFWNIVACKPRNAYTVADAMYAIVDRGEKVNHRYVVATINQDSIDSGEWIWGTYHDTLESALADFNRR